MNIPRRILELLDKDIIEDADFNEASKLFFEHHLSFNELQMNAIGEKRRKGLENLMIFADHLVLHKINSIDDIEKREYMSSEELEERLKQIKKEKSV